MESQSIVPQHERTRCGKTSSESGASKPRMLLGQGIPLRFRHLLPVIHRIRRSLSRAIRTLNLPQHQREIDGALAFSNKIASVPPVADLAPEHPILRLHDGPNYKLMGPLKHYGGMLLCVT